MFLKSEINGSQAAIMRWQSMQDRPIITSRHQRGYQPGLGLMKRAREYVNLEGPDGTDKRRRIMEELRKQPLAKFLPVRKRHPAYARKTGYTSMGRKY